MRFAVCGLRPPRWLSPQSSPSFGRYSAARHCTARSNESPPAWGWAEHHVCGRLDRPWCHATRSRSVLRTVLRTNMREVRALGAGGRAHVNADFSQGALKKTRKHGRGGGSRINVIMLMTATRRRNSPTHTEIEIAFFRILTVHYSRST